MGFGWTKWREDIEPELPYIQPAGVNGVRLIRVRDADKWLADHVRRPVKSRAS
jgi:hypothetical protein